MNKISNTLAILSITLLTIAANSHGQEISEAETKLDYRTIAVAFDPVQFLIGLLMGEVLVLSGNAKLFGGHH